VDGGRGNHPIQKRAFLKGNRLSHPAAFEVLIEVVLQVKQEIFASIVLDHHGPLIAHEVALELGREVCISSSKKSSFDPLPQTWFHRLDMNTRVPLQADGCRRMHYDTRFSPLMSSVIPTSSNWGRETLFVF